MAGIATAGSCYGHSKMPAACMCWQGKLQALQASAKHALRPKGKARRPALLGPHAQLACACGPRLQILRLDMRRRMPPHLDTLVDSCAGHDGGVQVARVAHHVRVGEVDAHVPVLATLERLDAQLGDLMALHLRLLVEGDVLVAGHLQRPQAGPPHHPVSRLSCMVHRQAALQPFVWPLSAACMLGRSAACQLMDSFWLAQHQGA